MSLMPPFLPSAGIIDVRNLAYNSVTLDLSAQTEVNDDPNMTGIEFADGKLYVSGYRRRGNPDNPPIERVFQYNLASAGTIAGATYSGISDDLDTGSGNVDPQWGRSLKWVPGGMRLLVSTEESSVLNMDAFDAVTAYSVNGLTYNASASGSISMNGNGRFKFNPAGDRLTTLDTNSRFEDNTLTTAFDPTTLVTSNPADTDLSATLGNDTNAFCFDNYGRTLLTCSGNNLDAAGITINQFSLSTPFDTTTATDTGWSFDVDAVIPDFDSNEASNMELSPNQNKLFLLSSERVYELDFE